MTSPLARSRVRRQAWALAAVALVLFALLRVVLGPLAQWASYHDLADTRRLGPIPRAGDVLTNLAILAAGLWGATLGPKLRADADERLAWRVFVAATIATALGSAWYHLAPSDATLVWDRLPMAIVMASLLALVIADRVDARFAREALLPFGAVGVASVAWWAATGDLTLYAVVRVGTGAAIVVLLILRPGRTRGAGWLWSAIALDVAMTLCERYDRAVWAATGELVSGHNVKHLLAGAVLACVFAWLTHRTPRPATA
ncbi:MAG TPA: hypothetical protein VII68_13985 [Casimicrobiaceae bacterium]